MHLKRRTIPKTWPIPRKGSKYIAVALSDGTSAMPLLLVMRDVLKIAGTRKELEYLIKEKAVMVNGKNVHEPNYPVNLFDTISLPAAKKNYRAVMKNKRIGFEEVSDKESQEKIYKVIGKKILNNKKVQLNLTNGRNILSSEKIEVGNFVLVNNSNNKIVKIMPLKEGENSIIISGKHIGKSGKIKSIVKEGENTVAEINTKEGGIRTNIKNLSLTN